MGLRELNVELTKEQAALWDASKKFFSQVWRPAAVALDKLADPGDVIAEDSILWDVFRQSFELGYHRLAFPQDRGGLDLDVLSLALVSELMGWAAPDLAISLGVCSTPYFWAGLSPHPEMQDLSGRFIADTTGKMTGCWAITEPDHGSDWMFFDNPDGRDPKLAPQVRAVLDGDHYVISGQKAAWVSNGSFARYAAVWLCLDPSQGLSQCGVAVVPLDLPGVSRGRPLNKLGQRALNQGEIFFDRVRIPRHMLIAEDPVTFKLMSNGQLALANGWMGLLFAGCSLAALEEALAYAKVRIQGGRPIFDHQNIKLKLFDMFVAVEAARSLARRVAVYNKALYDQLQPPAVHYAQAAKILSTETALRVASQAIQIFGGYGLSKEYLVEKIFRDARAALIADGVNETLALEGAERLKQGRDKWVATPGIKAAAAPSAAGAGVTWEDIEPMVRPAPGSVKMGVMKVDPDKCTGCGLCMENCPFRAWEKGEDGVPRMKAEHECFSCYNCLVACPAEAIAIVRSYHVTSGYFQSEPCPIPARPPAEPLDAQGRPDRWTPIERLIFERRSVRNFKPDPVPEPLIRRVLEAGRFAPSSGNCQPWKFIVITDKCLLEEMNATCFNVLSMLYTMYNNDALVKGFVQVYAQYPQPGLFDPRIILGGAGSVARRYGPTFLNAPAVILIACDDRAIGGPQIQAGLAGQNMNLAALSLGLGFCWLGFSQLLEMNPALKDKLGLKDPWKINTGMALGYPAFKQHGIVPREFRPITWFREGAQGPVVEA
ncbi:MAG: nitroreductase family protein [Thermodesulfobacteriota bacterium]